MSTALVKESIAFIDSDYTTHFRNALLAGGGSQYADISVSGDANPAGQTRFMIESVRMLSIQNIDWRVEFYQKTLPSATGSPNLNNLLGWVNLYSSGTQASTTLVQNQELSRIATAYATLFAYFAQNLKIPYHDKSQNVGGTLAGGQLHVNLVALGAAKNPGDSGLVHLRFGVVAAA